MIRKAFFLLVTALVVGVAQAQLKTSPSPTPQSPQLPQTPRPGAPFELSEYGVSLQPDARLIILMAPLDAADFDPTPPGKQPSTFPALAPTHHPNPHPSLPHRLH